VNEPLLRDLVGAVQDALVEAVHVWPDELPRDPTRRPHPRRGLDTMTLLR
jgi:hypothetical protein